MRPLRSLTFAALLASSFAASVWAAGTGLTGQYYDTASFGTLKTTRMDATVNFSWGTAIPSGTALTDADTFSVVWAGQVEPEFSEAYTFYVTADDGARLWVDDQLIVARTFSQGAGEMRAQVKLVAGQRVNLRLEYVEQTGTAAVKLEWSSASRAREVIPAARLYPARVDKAGGSLMAEHWMGVSGTAISALTALANYPNKPSAREFITSFECLAQDWAENYGTRVTGYIVPPTTGNYLFAVSGDETVELYLSTDATAANKTKIAYTSGASGFRQWTANATQQATSRALVQGQRYYVELLHKEGTGSDHWSVGWMKPGDAAYSVVPGSALVQPGLTTAQPAQANLLDTMAQSHPRIFATEERFAKLKAAYLSSTASQPKTWAQNAIAGADAILTQAPVAYSQDVRGTILDQARTAKDRMYKLGVAWWMTGNNAYADRAWTELSTVADNTAFPDWHPAHFLDTSEMTHACALGYDWFYNYWTQTQRDTLRTAIINKGLNAGLSQYTGNAGWSKSTGNNWNMVCNGGMTIGALAVGTENTTVTLDVLNRALNSTRPVWKHFTTDNGGWYEGPGYWGYTTEYGIRMFAALEYVLGSDFGISSTTNVAEAGLLPILSTGTSNVIFNYADAGAGGAPRGPVFQWFARRYGQPLYDWWENQGSGGALDALWWNDSSASLVSTGARPDMAFHGEAGTAYQPQEVVAMRGKFNDSRATYVATKGGQMGADHGNLDAGTFVIDALGKRWFHDLGGDDYALPGYFNFTPSTTAADRWDYYRNRPEGQNTLTIDPTAGTDMVLNAVAPLLAYQSEPGGTGSFAIHDLTPVYTGMTKVWRGTRLLGARNQVLVQDEIQAGSGKTVWWFAHYTYPTTTVTIDPDGTSATLQQGAERLWCKIVSGGGTFQIKDAVPFPTSPAGTGQNANAGYKKLAINLTGVTNTTLAVWFVPLSSTETVPTTLPTITPLSTWNLAAGSDAPNPPSGVATGDNENAVDIDLRAYVSDDSTPAELMRFTVGAAVNGTAVLLADGHTVRFTPTPGYTGVPSFDFTVTDTTPDSRAVLTWDFDLPDSSTANTVPDASGNGRDGTIDFVAAGTYTLPTDEPASLGGQGARSINLVEDGTNASRVQRVLTASEVDWNAGSWTVCGWFNRRDLTNDDMVWHISDGDGFGSNDELYLNCPAGATTVRLQHFNAVGAALDVDIVATGVAAGVWRHFAVVKNGTVLSLYVDGVLTGSDSSFTLALQQAQPLVFGGHATTTFQPGRWFDGGLDDLGVFNAPLTAGEIATLAGGMTLRHFGGLSATGTVSLSAAAVSFTWNSPATGAWSTGANWQAGAAPSSTRGGTVQFFTGQTLTGGTITANNDLAAGFHMNVLTLAGTCTAATTAAITGGSFTLLNNGTALPAVNLTATAGSGLVYNVNTPITLGADTTFNASANGTFIFNGVIDGAGALARTGTASKLVLAGTNSYTGDTTINSGTLQIGNDGATGSLGTGDVIDNGQLRFDRTGTLEVPNAITGTGSLYIDCPISAGTVVLSGTNTFDGTVTVNSGTLRITNSTALGDGVKTIGLSNGTAGAPQLRLDGSSDPIELPSSIGFLTSHANGAIVSEAGNNIIGGPITLTGGGGDTKIIVSAGSLALQGNISPNFTGRNLLLAGAGTGVVTGIISNGSPTTVLLGVNKQDAGTWQLAGANTHSGTTTVTAGRLMLGHPSALGNGGWQFGNTKGATSVTSGATLDLYGQTGVIEQITLNGSGVGSAGALINSADVPASIAGGTVSSISTTAGGTHSAVPNVTLTGGGGSGATAVATLGVSAASFTISSGTTLFSVAPTVTISGGGGTGATATAVLSSGLVTGITITNAGTGFTSTPTIAFTGGTVTTAGTAPTGTGNATNFVVSAIVVTSPGSGYTSVPAVAFDTGTGTTATANLSSVVLGSASSVGGAGDLTIGAPISGSTLLTKVGTGTLTLSATNTNTGGTTVSAGTLAVDGVLPAGGTATVAAGARLAGNGTVATNTTINGTLAPGHSPGTLTFTGTLALGATSRMSWELAGNTVSTPGTNYDRVMAGTVTVTTGAAVDVILDAEGSTVDFRDPFWSQNRSWTVLTGTSITGTVALGTVSSDSLGSPAAAWGSFSLQKTSTAVNIVWTAAAPFQQWQALNFGTNWNVSGVAGDLVDGDGDGVNNLLEYSMLNGDPNAVNAGLLPSAVKSSNGRLALTFDRAARGDVTISVVAADAPSGPWETAATSVSGAAFSVSANYEVVETGTHLEVRDRYLIGDQLHPRRFMRLQVTRP